MSNSNRVIPLQSSFHKENNGVCEYLGRHASFDVGSKTRL